jgi:hypothetical protein
MGSKMNGDDGFDGIPPHNTRHKSAVLNKYKDEKNYLLLLSCCLFACYLMHRQKKSFAVLGDSYSTYEDYLTPDTNAIWYFKKEGQENAPMWWDVKQTWWWQVIKGRWI